MAANAMKIYKVIKAEHSFQNVFVFCVSLIFSLKQFSHFISFFLCAEEKIFGNLF